MSTLQPGTALGASYKLSAVLGSGAAGEVWRAELLTGADSVAAKILKPEHARDPELVERFIRERSVLIGLRHPNIVAVRDLVVEGDIIAIVMDLIQGGSLRELLEANETLRPGEALALVSQVFLALAEAHSRSITHRDIKPDNVLLAGAWPDSRPDMVRVADFGIASVVSERHRQTTGLLGTPQYMAPELISHGTTTPAADVYSTGVMLYELIAGRTPFAGPGTDFTVAYRHVTSQPPRLEVPDHLADWVDRLLAKDPLDRPTAAEAAAEASRLAKKYASLDAVAKAQLPAEFVDIERPATMVKASPAPATDRATADELSPLNPETPLLGEPSQETIVRPMARPTLPPLVEEEQEEPAASDRFGWLKRKSFLIGSAGVVSVLLLGGGLFWIFGGSSEAATPVANDVLTVSQQDQPLPTGLGVSRTATFDPAEGNVSLEVRYTAQKAPLAGSFLEVVPGKEGTPACPPVVWDEVDGAKHQASTGIDAKCGWRLGGITIPAGGETVVTGSLPLEVADEAELREWLGQAASLTQEALLAPEASSTAYPVQRLVDVAITIPPRAIGQTTLPISLLPVWPSGTDEVNPLYQSPATGAATQMLESIAGGEAGVRFSDGCSGAVAVSSDGLTVTTLAPTVECRIRASVGNFTSIESSPMSITTRD